MGRHEQVPRVTLAMVSVIAMGTNKNLRAYGFAAITLLMGVWSLPATSEPTAETAARLSMIKTLQEAQEQNQGRVEISFRGPLPPELIATIASTSRFRSCNPGEGCRRGRELDCSWRRLCGYRSERFAELLIAYNVGKFQPVVGGTAEQSTVIGSRWCDRRA